MESTLLQEAAGYVGFTVADADVLREVAPAVRPRFSAIVDRFYEAIAGSPRAAAVFTGGQEQMSRQKASLREWLEEVVGGVYDQAYFERHSRIGRVHVRIGLDQRYMLTAMCIIREGLHNALDQSDFPAERRRAAHDAFNRICDIELAIMLETYRDDSMLRIRRTEQLATLGQLAASIGHELRNPLAVIESSAHLLGRRATDEHAQRHLRKIDTNLKVAGDIIGQLLELVRDREAKRHPVDLADVLQSAVDSIVLPPGVRLDVELDPGLPRVRLDAGQLRMVLANLLANAGQAIAGSEGTGGGDVRVHGKLEHGTLCVRVEDDGPGLSEEALAHAFEPLFTTRSKGIGLGLALCRRIVERHGGTITGANAESGGARFEIRLPGVLADAGAAAGPA